MLQHEGRISGPELPAWCHLPVQWSQPFRLLIQAKVGGGVYVKAHVALQATPGTPTVELRVVHFPIVMTLIAEF